MYFRALEIHKCLALYTNGLSPSGQATMTFFCFVASRERDTEIKVFTLYTIMFNYGVHQMSAIMTRNSNGNVRFCKLLYIYICYIDLSHDLWL